MRLLLLAAALLAGSAFAAPAAPLAETTTRLTLADARQRTLLANPQLAVARLERDAAEAGRDQAALWAYNPELSFEQESPRRAASSQTWRLSQTLETGGQRKLRQQAATELLLDADARWLLARQELDATVYERFMQVLAAQESTRLAEDNLALARLAQNAADKRVAAGKAPPMEATRAAVASAQADSSRLLAQSRLAIARQALAALWQGDARAIGEASGSLDPAEAPAIAQPAPDALPALAGARARLAALEAEQRLAERDTMPAVTLSGGITRSDNRDDDATLIGISLPLPLINRNQGKRREARIRVEQSRHDMEALQLELQTRLDDAEGRRAAASQERDALQGSILPGAEEAFRIATRGYELGKFSFLDVLDAERTLMEARQQLLDASLRLHTARADLGRVLGFAPVTASTAP